MITTTKYFGSDKTLTSGAANTKGSFGEVISAANFIFDASGFMYGLAEPGKTGAASQYLVDLAFGTTVVLANAHISGGLSTFSHINGIYVPLKIPSGTQIQARTACETATQTVRMAVSAVHAVGLPSFAKATTYGADTGDSGGTSVDAGPTGDTFGAYSQMTASCDLVRWMLVFIGTRNNIAPANTFFQLRIGVGAATSEIDIHTSETLRMITSAGSDTVIPCAFSFPITIPAGSRIAFKIKSGTNNPTDRVLDFVAIGLH